MGNVEPGVNSVGRVQQSTGAETPARSLLETVEDIFGPVLINGRLPRPVALLLSGPRLCPSKGLDREPVRPCGPRKKSLPSRLGHL